MQIYKSKRPISANRSAGGLAAEFLLTKPWVASGHSHSRATRQMTGNAKDKGRQSQDRQMTDKDKDRQSQDRQMTDKDKDKDRQSLELRLATVHSTATRQMFRNMDLDVH